MQSNGAALRSGRCGMFSVKADEEFERVAMANVDLVYALARRLVPTAADAEDLVQETFLRALTGWRRTPPDDAAAWLATICRNAAKDSYRRRQARPVEVSREAELAAMPATQDTAAQALANLDAREVHDALWQLPTATREAITLVDLCGLTAAAAADVLGVPRGTVLSRVHRGHKALAALIRREVSVDGARS